jgi:hypothetical protein
MEKALKVTSVVCSWRGSEAVKWGQAWSQGKAAGDPTGDPLRLHLKAVLNTCQVQRSESPWMKVSSQNFPTPPSSPLSNTLSPTKKGPEIRMSKLRESQTHKSRHPTCEGTLGLQQSTQKTEYWLIDSNLPFESLLKIHQKSQRIPWIFIPVQGNDHYPHQTDL